MNLGETVKGVNVTELAQAIGVPRRTLFRWVEENRIPGRDAEKKLWSEKIERAAARLKKDAA